jgi:hypothetical protein
LKWFTDREIAALPKPILIANYMVDRSKQKWYSHRSIMFETDNKDFW